MAPVEERERAVLPEGWSARVPGDADIGALTALLDANRRAGSSTPVDVATLTALVVGPASWTRRQRVVLDPSGRLVGWAVVHDRAAGRTEVTVLVAPDAREQDAVASGLFAWADRAAAEVAALRRVRETQLDASADSDDERQRAWLGAAGYACVRTWLKMVRPVAPEEGEPGALPAPRPGVRVRRVREHANGLPTAEDLQTVHLVLEQSFADHFNSYREGFAEFVVRLQEDPWHRWDHWWVAEVEQEGVWRPGGALISSVSPPDASGAYGSYVDYIGVHRRARGRGVAKALLNTVIGDAARRGRPRVSLEVDADSSTNADGLYLSMGWVVDHRTESWHRYLQAGVDA
ncbi:Acetyltransferase (GNAT) family protein [Microlunatus sagamiharensis]|uniref:Acetyltransferase (GNAT) family protein n=1 Tax=Microlunatus sagamiharensis TaxID=546874 RepID=A0A1H2MD48_9ACTN|nr:GNAT family N-acetyltransferase [Microlunatus sagamiharensis]SDU90851.1 Acetyltransferase (GNAT) family protein [Microlunatus sagamiharensis]